MIALPRKITTAVLNSDFARQTFQFASDAYDTLRAVKAHFESLQAEVDALETTVDGLDDSMTLGGDVSGVPSNVQVNQSRGLRETSGPTTLTMGSVPTLTILRRSAASVLEGCVPGDFTHQTSPTSAVKLMIDDGGVIKYCTAAELLALGATGNPFIDVPSSPNTFDDEFNSGSDDLAIRGWTVKTSGGTTLTRGGDIQPWSGTGPTSTTYWSRLTGSFLFVQIPAATTVFIFKSVSLSAGDHYFARIGSNYRFDSSGDANFCEVGFYGNSAGTPDLNNRVYCSIFETSTGMKCDMGRITGGAAGVTSRALSQTHDIRGVRLVSGSSYSVFSADSANGQSQSSTGFAGAMSSANVAYFGIAFTSPTAGATPNIHCIDYARKKTGDAWLIG